MTRQIRFSAFETNCVGHQLPGLSAHPHDRSGQYKDPDDWQDLARARERGIFIAEVFGYCDVYQGSSRHALHEDRVVGDHVVNGSELPFQ